MTQTLTPTSITYTAEIAACSSYGLESSFGRSRDYVFRGTKLSAHQPVDPEAAAQEGGPMSDLVMLTNVDETLPEARTRIRRELDAVVRSWTDLTRAARRRRLWTRWSAQYPSLTDLDPVAMWNTTDPKQDQAMVDMIRLMPAEPDAFAAFVTKSRFLLLDLTRRTVPADLGDLAAVALAADCDVLATRRRPLMTLYTRARRQSRKTLIPRKASVQPLTASRGFSSNHSDPAKRSRSRTIVYAPFGASNPTDTIDTMLSVDRICRHQNEARWNQLIDETLHDIPTLTPRTRRRVRAQYRTSSDLPPER